MNDTNGNAITDPDGYCGFPGFDGMLAQNTLGYVARCRSTACRSPTATSRTSTTSTPRSRRATRTRARRQVPGELGHEQQLKDYDHAFENFFQNLKQHGIDRHNTLFAITVDEGDHFAGGVGTPQSGQNWLLYNHTQCNNLSTCPANQIGEIHVEHVRAHRARTTTTSTSTTLPPFYVNGKPGPTDTGVRALERNVGGLISVDPYVRARRRAADGEDDRRPRRPGGAGRRCTWSTPIRTGRRRSWTSAIPTSSSRSRTAPAASTSARSSGFAWNHGDIQHEIGNTWAGIVGPGVAKGGLDPNTWTDHTNLRPTILSLVGLKDDYTDDGHVLVQALEKPKLPKGLSGSKIADLENAYEQLNAPFGAYSADTLAASTKALEGSDSDYSTFVSDMTPLESNREGLAKTIRDALYNAAFNGGTISQSDASNWISQANGYISQAAGLPH